MSILSIIEGLEELRSHITVIEPVMAERSFHLGNARLTQSPSYSGTLRGGEALAKFVEQCVLGFVPGMQMIVRGAGAAPWTEAAVIIDRMAAAILIVEILRKTGSVYVESLMSTEVLNIGMTSAENNLELRIIPSLKKRDTFEKLLLENFADVPWSRQFNDEDDAPPELLKKKETMT